MIGDGYYIIVYNVSNAQAELYWCHWWLLVTGYWLLSLNASYQLPVMVSKQILFPCRHVPKRQRAPTLKARVAAGLVIITNFPLEEWILHSNSEDSKRQFSCQLRKLLNSFLPTTNINFHNLGNTHADGKYFLQFDNDCWTYSVLDLVHLFQESLQIPACLQASPPQVSKQNLLPFGYISLRFSTMLGSFSLLSFNSQLRTS